MKIRIAVGCFAAALMTGASFAADVILSSVAFWALVVIEGGRAAMRRLWLPVAANVIVGLSLGLPLFLYLRERRLDSIEARA